MQDFGKSSGPGDAAQNDIEESGEEHEEGSEYSEDESSNDEKDDPADETILKADHDGSLSLRAELVNSLFNMYTFSICFYVGTS